ncbi:MAG: hypothetical protein JSR41_09820 [Proteobacteria bacterium]|nr:hypothetical protein [Pseudomonadota bacterium]
MSHGRKPRRPRWAPSAPLGRVVQRVTRYTEAELEQILQPLRASLKALREGVATELQWSVLCTAVVVAQTIERQGIVRGLREHLASAERALEAIRHRAMESGAWAAVPLHLQEIDVLDELVDLHTYQLRHPSAAEAVSAARNAGHRARAVGGQVVTVDERAWINRELLA